MVMSCILALQGNTVAQLSQRKGTVTEVDGADYAVIKAEIPLDNMFGYSSDLRSSTQVALEPELEL